MKKYKTNNFLNSILTLVYSQVLIKFLGLIYSVYLTNKKGFGDNGNAIYMSGYQIYAILLTLSSVGIPNAISKLVAEKMAQCDYKGANRIFKISLMLFSVIGFCASIILYIFAEFISNTVLQISETEEVLKTISPAIFFVSITSVLRGYFNGVNKINNTAKSQTIEQIFKTVFTLVLVEIVAKLTFYNTESMAVVATLATTFATMLGCLYSYIKYKKYQKDFNKIGMNYEKESILIILKKILKISIPITLSSLIAVLNKNIDSVTVVRILSPIIGNSSAKAKYGILSSKVDTLVTMPLAINIAISTTIVPTISKLVAQKDLKSVVKKIKESLFLSCLIGFPCTFGMAMYSKEILLLLFPNASQGSNLLFIESFSIIFAILTQTINGILQGIGKNKISVIALGCGAIFKIIINITLLPIKGIYENGAAIGTVVCNIVAFLIVYNVIKKEIKFEFNLTQIAAIPLISTILMCACSYLLYLYISSIFSMQISLVFAIIVAVISYFFFINIFIKYKIIKSP